MKIKELCKENDKRYFEGELFNKKVIFCVYEFFGKKYTLDEINGAFEKAELPG